MPGIAVIIAHDELNRNSPSNLVLCPRNWVYRGTGAKPWLVDYVRVGSTQKAGFSDRGLKREGVYYYYVVAEDAEKRQGRSSVKVRTQPWVVQDVVVSALGAREVELTWKSPGGSDVIGYQVERADVRVYAMSELKRLSPGTPY